jgi:hypothetical protein
MACFGAAAGERCHENAIGHLEGAELEGLEECGMRHGFEEKQYR